MIAVKEAKQLIDRSIVRDVSSNLSLVSATNLVLADDVPAAIDVPSFDNAAMDGYAFRYCPETYSYKISQHIQAGDPVVKGSGSGEAVRIFTGAPVPVGFDTVIQQELCSVANGVVEFDISGIKKGANVRMQGTQNRKGDIVVKAGTVIKPATIGLLASVGVTTVAVHTPPSVAFIITGNELQEAGTELQSGHIYNSNEPVLEAFITCLGIKKYCRFKVKDDPALLKEKVALCLEKFDVLILTGGISVGEYDFVQEALINKGVEALFYKVKQKPGKPLFVGKKKDKWVFALPGNPAAVITCFHQYVKPCILGMMGYRNTFEPDAVLPLSNEFHKKAGLTYFLKAKKENNTVVILNGQDSFNLLPFAEADCIVVADETVEYLPAGTLVSVYNL